MGKLNMNQKSSNCHGSSVITLKINQECQKTKADERFATFQQVTAYLKLYRSLHKHF